MGGKITKITKELNKKVSKNFQLDSENIIHNSVHPANYNTDGGNIIEKYKDPCYCTDSERNKLQKEVENQCKGGIMRKCTDVDNCSLLIGKIDQFTKCMEARIKINTKCFKGGDLGHNIQVQQAINGIINCQAIYARKCIPKEQVPKPKEVPVADEDFMRKMEKITGLTGTALIIYLIISEGSRLFPPRNLVPIP